MAALPHAGWEGRSPRTWQFPVAVAAMLMLVAGFLIAGASSSSVPSGLAALDAMGGMVRSAAARPVHSSRSEPALRLEAGAVTSQQLVGVGRDVIVQGQALADIAALDGSVEISGQVTGDVVVLRGNVRLAPTARVGGDIFVVGGTIRAAPGAHAAGRMVSYPTASNAWMTLMEGPSLGLGFASRMVVGAKLALMAAW